MRFSLRSTDRTESFSLAAMSSLVSPCIRHIAIWRSVSLASNPISGDGIDDVLVLRQDGAVLYRQGTLASISGSGESGDKSVTEFGTAVELNPGHPARDFALLRSPSGLRIATLDVSGSAVSLYQFDGAATLAEKLFRMTDSVPISGSIPARIASGNFDHDLDGRDDFALINQGTQTVTLYLADATGFRPTESFNAGAGPVSFTTTDLNRDGLTDFLVPNFGSGDVSVFTNVGEGDFANSLFRTGPGPYFSGPTPYDASRIESQSFDKLRVRKSETSTGMDCRT